MDDTDFRFSPRPNRAADIQWCPWGEAAFEQARRLGRPVLLSLSAVWCHWCHVMDETSCSDPQVIPAINEQYVPVRVDNDRRPDVNRRYNMGGWPTVAFLTPGGDIITGATYVPPDQLLQALDRVREFFDANKASLQQVESPTLEEPGDQPHEPDDAALAHIPGELAGAIIRSFDPVYGGIGSEPKFPQADAFAFLLSFTALHPGAADTPRAGEVLVKTLEAMARGGLYDHGGEGFFRYATQRDWSEPHYEKMLEDEARLTLLYAEALGLAQAGLAGLERARALPSRHGGPAGPPAAQPVAERAAGLRRQPGCGRELLRAGRRSAPSLTGAGPGPHRVRRLERAGGAGPAACERGTASPRTWRSKAWPR